MIAGCTSAGRTITTSAVTAGCVPFSTPTSVDQLNAQLSSTAASPYFRGADVGASVRLSDGRGMWVFGDTIRDEGAKGGRMVRNSMLMWSPGCLTSVLPDGGGAFVPDRDASVGYWPMSIAVSPRDGYDLVGIMMQRVTGSGNAWSFQTLGPALAVVRVDPGKKPQLLSISDLGLDDASSERPAWGAAATIGIDGFVYLYGTSKPGDGSSFGYAVQVARVPVDQVLDQTKWTYWDGYSWQGNPLAAVKVIGAVGGVSQTFSVIFQNGKTYAISKRDEAIGNDLVVWVADAPEGPFYASDPVAYIPSDPEKKLWVYMPIAHPELLPKPGAVVVSVSQNSDDLARVLQYPQLYRPTFMEITLPK